MSKPTGISIQKAELYPWRRFTLLMLGLFLSGCATARTKVTFERHEVVTGPAKRQSVLTGFFLDRAMAELAAITIDENGQRQLSLYALNDYTGSAKLNARLHHNVLFVDVAKIGGRDRLVTYEQGRLNWFDPKSRTERLLATVTSNFDPPRKDEIPHVDITHDVNHDSLDDLLVPCADGFRVFIQKRGGTFADPVKIGPAFDMDTVYATDGYRYDPWRQSRIHQADYNRDGRSDLLYWNHDHFEVHLQNRNRLFARAAKTFTTEVAFDSDDLSTLAAPQGVRHRRKDHQPAGAMTGRVLHALTDLNGDHIADLGVFVLEGGKPWKMHSSYEVHLGTQTDDGGTAFEIIPSTAIHLSGILYEMKHHDFNHDGQIDMAFKTFSPNVVNTVPLLVGAMLTKSVPEDLKFFRLNDGSYPNKPSATRTISARPGGSGQQKQYPAMLIGDLNGDRFSDLLVHDGQKQLRVFTGVAGPDLFARRPGKVAVAMPKEDYTWLADLNQDGKQDIIAHHPSTTEPHRVTTMIAK